MYTIEENKDITSFTTFGLPVRARWFVEYASQRELLHLSRQDLFINNEVLQIGGGSNLLFMGDYDGLVIHSAIKGIKRYDKNADTTYVIAGAGEKWTDFVEWCVDRGLSGIENLAGIPGEVGASAVQNVGAYGVEAGDRIHALECFDCQTRNVVNFRADECEFAYRDSFFKNAGRGRYIVLRVSFRLDPDGRARNLEYGPLKSFAQRLGHEPSLREVADEVKRIRAEKLPDPAEIGSAGSFFKNPMISQRYFDELHRQHPDMPGFPLENGRVKLSAAWLIDHSGLKGCRRGGAEVYRKQPLVIANRGSASAENVAALAREVRRRVRAQFRVDLHPEVNYIDTTIRVTVLGSGTSKGVPEVNCDCHTCTSPYKKDKRTRASVMVSVGGMSLLIDASPDFRAQALREEIHDVDAVLITHSHYDHVGGFDDLRPFCGEKALPVYVRADVNDALHRRLDYCFNGPHYPGAPRFDMRVIENNPFYIRGVKVEPIEVLHGKLPIFSYRIGRFAYVTDAKYISEVEKEKLEGLDVLIVNALMKDNHFAHFTLQEALDLIAEVKPKQAYLTHFNHEMPRHYDLKRELPPNVHPAYDGLKIEIK